MAKQESDFITSGVGFFQDSWLELKKVQVPTKQETIQATMIVLVVLVVFALFLGAADLLVGKVMQNILT